MGKIEEKPKTFKEGIHPIPVEKKPVEKTEEDTYALSKRVLKRDIESLKDSIQDLDKRLHKMSVDLEMVMDRMGL